METWKIILILIIIIVIAFFILEWFGFIDIIPGIGEPRPGGTGGLLDYFRYRS